MPTHDGTRNAGRTPAERAATATVGRSFFLGIGIDAYAHFGKLNNAVRDMEAVRDLLVADYDVEPDHCRLLRNAEATRRDILRALRDMDTWVGQYDKLIIYYSGHGHLNRHKRGFWVPVDADRGVEADFVSNADLREILADVPARHILLISDACFSGALFVRGADRADAASDELEIRPSRWALCSGRHDQLVADGEPGQHSPFAASILTELRSNRHEALRIGTLADRVIELTRANYDQLPEGNPLQGVGHQGGQYVFRRRVDEADIWADTQRQATPEAYRAYLAAFPQGAYALEAQATLHILTARTDWAAIQALPDNHPAEVATKRQRIRDFCRNHPNSPDYDAALTLGVDMEHKGELLRAWDSEFLLMGFIRKETPYRAAAQRRLDELTPPPPQPQPQPNPPKPGNVQTDVRPSPTPQKEETPIRPVVAPTPKPKPAPAPPPKAEDVKPDSRPSSQENVEKPPKPAPETKWAAIGIAAVVALVLLVVGVRQCGQPDEYKEPSSTPDAKANPNAATIADIAANMVTLPGSTFTMGCQDGRDTDYLDDEKPPHEVTISTFHISKYEVTQAQWRAVMGSNPSEHKNCDQCPVENVSWNDIQDFLRQLNAQTGQNYRLPTEAEWEYAARGGNSSRGYGYSGSNTIGEVAWYDGNSSSKTHTVGGKKANELGLYDMSGNVYEWCSDWYGSYAVGAQTNPKGASLGTHRVGRGGNWNDIPQSCRAARRCGWHPTYRLNYLGFRLARS